ncbi:MAG: Smr/MutS family protein [Pseudomonadota bacterium]
MRPPHSDDDEAPADGRTPFDRLIGPKNRRPMTLSPEEAADWAAAVADIAPLTKDRAAPPPPAKLRFEASDRRADASPVPQASAPPLATGLERALEKRARRGDLAIDAKIDLHGMTAERARAALARFLRSAQGEGRRCVLVVTGKGQRIDQGGRPGIIREALPDWLRADDLRPYAFAHRLAHAKHGGDGARYVFLRKQKRA